MELIKIQGEEEKRNGIYYEVDFHATPIGFGGMGTVMKGTRVDSNGQRIDVAIKFLFEDLHPNAVDRARREASIQLQNDNLVKMYGFVETYTNNVRRLHVVSEFLDGIMLLDFLNGNLVNYEGKTSAFIQQKYQQFISNREGFAIEVIKNVLSGIMALHDAGFIHRDIDPSNIMLTNDGKIKLIDFGVARSISTMSSVSERKLTTDGNFIGKASYAAPELIMGDVDHQNKTTDIYAIGILFFQLITGELPFDGPTHEVMEMQLHNPLPLSKIDNSGIRNVIAKATDKKQNLRYQSAAEFRVALDSLSQGNIKQQVPPQKYKSTSNSNWIYAITAVFGGILIGLIIFLILHWI